MKNLGRCGRNRRSNSKKKKNKSESHLPEFIRFHQWIKKVISKDHCQTVKSLEPAFFSDTGRGLKCKHNLAEGDMIVSIPCKLLITTQTVFNSDLGPILNRTAYKFTPLQLVSLFLITEQCKGENSFWYPYISLMPQVYSVSVYFSKKELKLLTPRAYHLALECQRRFNRAYEQIFEFIAKYVPHCMNKVDFDIIKWGWSTVETRSVFYHTEEHPLLIADPEESHVAIAPFLDFLNHKDTAKIRAGVNTESHNYEIITDDKYRKHDQVFISYGPHDNATLAVSYGFTIPQNIHNVFYFTMDDLKTCVTLNSTHWVKTHSIIKETRFDQNLFCNKDGLSWPMMMTLKILVMPQEFLSSWKSIITKDFSESSENSNHAYMLAKKILAQALVKAKRHLHYVVQQSKSTHFSIIESLAQDDVHILETTIQSLPLPKHSLNQK